MTEQKQNKQVVNTNPMIVTPSNGVCSDILSFHFKKNLAYEEGNYSESEKKQSKVIKSCEGKTKTLNWDGKDCMCHICT